MTESTTSEGVAEASEGLDTGISEESISEESSEESVEEVVTESEGTEEVSTEETSEGSEEVEAKFEVIVDGTPVSLTRDELIKGFQLGSASHERFRNAAQMKKEAESSLDAMMADPIAAFLKAGGDEAALRDLTETYLYGKIQQDKMTPEERELAELKQYKEQAEQRQKDQADQKQQEANTAQTKKYEEEYIASFNQAFEAAGVAPTESAMSRVAQIQLSALEAGYEVPVDMVINQYKDEQSAMISQYLSSLDSDGISSVIGKDRMKEIRKKELAGAKNPKPRKAKTTAPDTAHQESVSMTDFFDSLK